MELDLMKARGTPLEKQRFTWKELVQAPSRTPRRTARTSTAREAASRRKGAAGKKRSRATARGR